MTAEQRKAIERRWATFHGRGAHDYTDEGCRVLAEHAFRDVAALLAERDAAVNALKEALDVADDVLRQGENDGSYNAHVIAEALDRLDTLAAAVSVTGRSHQ